jgi:hypothetical protein
VLYDKLNHFLAEHGFVRAVEQLCELSYAAHQGRPSIPLGGAVPQRIARPPRSGLFDGYS